MTANEISSFAEILRLKEVSPDFLKNLDRLFNIFEKEFVESLPVGRSYRKRCFAEIEELVFKAIGRMQPVFSQAILQLHPILISLNHGRQMTGYIAEELEKGMIQDRRIVFHLYCYAYLIMVEGIFDELARVLFFFKTVTKSNIPKTEDLKRMEVWDIFNKLGSTPVFLKNWKEKKSIRNAIGHATVYYDLEKNKIRFIDEQSSYDRTLTLNQFTEMALELDDSVAAYTYIMMLLRLHDLILSTNPF